MAHQDDGASGKRIHQGEPTYDPADVSEAARRSQWRKEQHDEGAGWTGRREGESDEDYARRLEAVR